jgi:hypothetical protein
MGLKAGGITGKIVKIIQAGLDPVPTKFSRIRIRFYSLLTNFINSLLFPLNHFDSSYMGFLYLVLLYKLK